MKHSASVMLLDEATSALDADSETHVKETLEAEFAGKTIVIIAQVLSRPFHAIQNYLRNEKLISRGFSIIGTACRRSCMLTRLSSLKREKTAAVR